MVLVLASRPYNPRVPVIFNVEGVVGAKPSANLPDDVVLVKAFLRMIGQAPTPTFDAAAIARFLAIQVSPTPDTALIEGIKAFQQAHHNKNPGQIVDGRMSPAKENYDYGTAVWSIVLLNNSMKIPERFGAVWPCVHLAGNCHPLLKAVAKKAISGED
jgi:hypothetical protein